MKQKKETPMWRTVAGFEVPIKDMTDAHLEAACVQTMQSALLRLVWRIFSVAKLLKPHFKKWKEIK